MKLLKFIFLLIILISGTTKVFGQITGNGQGKAWVILTSEYNTSPFNQTTDVNIYFDGSDYNGNITSVQFRIGYDGDAFTEVSSIENLLGSEYIINYNDDTAGNTVLVSIVYSGSSSTQTISDGAIITIKYTNIPESLIYSQEQNRSSFNFSGFTPIGSNSLGNDVTLASLNHGGQVKIPHRRYYGFVQDYATKTGIPNLEYRLIKDSGQGTTGTLQTVLSNNQPTLTQNTGYYELVYYEHYYGYYVAGSTKFSLFFKTEDVSGVTSSNPPALSTTDSYLQLRYATQKETFSPIQLLASDVNQSHTSTIADAYSSFARFSSRFPSWLPLGPGGYRDVMVIDPKNIKYLEHESTAVTQLGIGPLGFKPKMTNWTYVLEDYINYDGPNSHAGQDQFEKDIYVVLMGDVNQTGLGGLVKPGSANKMINIAGSDTTSTIDTMFVNLPDIEGAVGEYVFVPVEVNTKDVPVGSFGFRLNYNSEVIEFIEATSAALSSSWMLYFNADSLNVLDFGGMDGSGGDFPIVTDEFGTMLRLKFKILNNRQTRVPLEFSGNKTAGDIEGRDMVVKVTSGEVSTNGVIIPVTPPVVLPDVIDLKHNYPNPFSTSTTIGIDIPSGGSDVILDVYDTLGRYVTTVFKGRLIAGTHEFNFDGRNLTSGLYIYRLRTSEKVLTKKMILIK